MNYEVKGIIGAQRNAVAYGVVSAVDDTGQVQTANVSTGTGVNRAEVEVLSQFGFSSVPPADGVVGLVVAIGGDPANLVVLPLANPSARFGGLLTGESVMYAADGSRVHIREGGIVDIWGGTQVNVHTKNCTITAPNGCLVNGDTTVEGNATTTGNLVAGTGATGCFVSATGQSVTVQDGIITNIY
jgi:phage baseplate assembly protein V